MDLTRLSRARRLVAGIAVATAVALVASCGSSDGGSTKVYVATAPSSVRVVAVGDIACVPGKEVTAKTCRQADTGALARRLRPDLVLTLGDHQYEEGTRPSFMASYDKSWGSLWSKTRPALGNHEYYDPNAAGYYDYFEGRQPGPPGYYRVRAKGWNVFVLNSNCDRVDCDVEAAWLDEQMKAHPSKCSIVTMHHARYSSGTEHGDTEGGVRDLWATALRHRNDVVLAGHDHDYERFAAMNANGAIRPRRGMVSFVSGAGGKDLYKLGERRPGSRYAQADKAGVLFLELKPTAWSWRFIDVDGRVRDKGSRRCR